ncbi:LysE family transporter [Candidatus Desulfovibrio trichonymphae]|uniref:LysE family transporter n=1 Tax=Candidatus Desulfovibrio trichonymphae TaxID=1725232 RepID=UPI0022196361|nr:hypothetical protein AGMMS50248_06160 [Deltaproteobacteria bacterium]
MLSPDVLFAFFAASLLLGVAPGPDNIFVLTQSAVHGAGAGGATTLLGLVTGLCVHTIAVALGVAVLLQSSPVAFAVLKACILPGFPSAPERSQQAVAALRFPAMGRSIGAAL